MKDAEAYFEAQVIEYMRRSGLAEEEEAAQIGEYLSRVHVSTLSGVCSPKEAAFIAASARLFANPTKAFNLLCALRSRIEEEGRCLGYQEPWREVYNELVKKAKKTPSPSPRGGSTSESAALLEGAARSARYCLREDRGVLNSEGLFERFDPQARSYGRSPDAVYLSGEGSAGGEGAASSVRKRSERQASERCASVAHLRLGYFEDERGEQGVESLRPLDDLLRKLELLYRPGGADLL
ncbi:hypothetical protein D6783_05720 [Candidatus Woesearchaeota archaeon]|nr:MAG: hypothetical protein D6783_05720 [Candidatus Woesearchaeota archaeon]